MTRQNFFASGRELDVVKSDSPENILRCIPKYDRGGVSRFADNFPEGTP